MSTQLDTVINSYRTEMIHHTCKLIRIPSIKEAPGPGMPFGQPVSRCLDTVLDLCRSLGFRTKNCAGYAGWAEIGDGEELVGILVHVDVVPAGNGWSLEPFAGIHRDGRIYGRGAIDDKGPAVAAIYAVKAILDSGQHLNRRIRLIFGADEENNWECMDYYQQHEEVPSSGFSPDALFPVIYAEKGILYASISAPITRDPQYLNIRCLSGGERANMVPDTCHAEISVPDHMIESITDLMQDLQPCEFITTDWKGSLLSIHASGTSAHGSMPEQGTNAISRLLSVLAKLENLEPSQKKFILFYQSRIGSETSGERLFGPVRDLPSGALVFNAGVLQLNEKHADEASIDLKVNIRYPVTFTGEEIMERFRESLKDCPFELTEELNSPPLYHEKDSDIVKTLLLAYRKYTGDDSQPIVTGGGTYARSMPNAVAFGPVFPGQPELAHCPDEFIEEENLLLSAKIYAQALIDLTNGGNIHYET